MPSYNVLFL